MHLDSFWGVIGGEHCWKIVVSEIGGGFSVEGGKLTREFVSGTLQARSSSDLLRGTGDDGSGASESLLSNCVRNNERATFLYRK